MKKYLKVQMATDIPCATPNCDSLLTHAGETGLWRCKECNSEFGFSDVVEIIEERRWYVWFTIDDMTFSGFAWANTADEALEKVNTNCRATEILDAKPDYWKAVRVCDFYSSLRAN